MTDELIAERDRVFEEYKAASESYKYFYDLYVKATDQASSARIAANGYKNKLAALRPVLKELL